MMTLKVNGKDYNVEFSFNDFCDTDLMEKVQELTSILQSGNVESDKDVSAIGQIKDLFCVVRELIFVGNKNFDTLQDVGRLLDEYKREKIEGEERGLMQLFTMLSEELFAEGFLSDILMATQEAEKKAKKPSDHLKKVK